MEFFEITKEFVSLPICIIFVVILQLIKKQLEKKKIKFKDENSWFWVTLCMGFPLAFLFEGMNGLKDWNWFRYVIESFAFAGGCTVIYKLAKKISFNKIKEFFTEKK